jgi:pyruvate/2-oxoglutarate dehydrogenase complex dihydrolipoamide dehydrogenase (E3) component
MVAALSPCGCRRRCTYRHPQLASMGLTKAVAKERSFDVRVAASPSSATAGR